MWCSFKKKVNLNQLDKNPDGLEIIKFGLYGKGEDDVPCRVISCCNLFGKLNITVHLMLLALSLALGE